MIDKAPVKFIGGPLNGQSMTLRYLPISKAMVFPQGRGNTHGPLYEPVVVTGSTYVRMEYRGESGGNFIQRLFRRIFSRVRR